MGEGRFLQSRWKSSTKRGGGAFLPDTNRKHSFKLKFMHIFIEQLYKILPIVASACLICQQVLKLNYKKQGFMSCSELLGHLKLFFFSFFKKRLTFFFFLPHFHLKVLNSIKPVTDIQSRVPNNRIIIGIKWHVFCGTFTKTKPFHL